MNALVGPDGAARTWFSNTADSTGSTSVEPGDEPPGHDYLKASPMKAVSLDTLARRYGFPDMIKIDVEGFEMQILDSAREVLARKPAVVLEFNSLCLSNFG
ncbi:MAG: FkbM family methyltransferase, partial [Hyphomonadaceae bacterium]|nr:FkbM family methyltransferase [Hyphomonadaceae bacterium]